MTQELIPAAPAPEQKAPEEQLNDLRAKILRGEEVSVEQYALVIASLRARRLGETASAVEKKKEKVAKAKETAPPVDLDSLLSGLLPKG